MRRLQQPFGWLTLNRLEYSLYRGCADGQSCCPENTIQKIREKRCCIDLLAGLIEKYADVLDIDSLPDPKEKKNISEFIDLKCESVEIKEAA